MHDVPLVPSLVCELFSAVWASKKGKVITLFEIWIVHEIKDSKSKLIATGCGEESLCYPDHSGFIHQTCSSSNQKKPSGIANLDT